MFRNINASHYSDGEGWNDQADFWDMLHRFISRDGWTHNTNYEQAAECWAEVKKYVKTWWSRSEQQPTYTNSALYESTGPLRTTSRKRIP